MSHHIVLIKSEILNNNKYERKKLRHVILKRPASDGEYRYRHQRLYCIKVYNMANDAKPSIKHYIRKHYMVVSLLKAPIPMRFDKNYQIILKIGNIIILCK